MSKAAKDIFLSAVEIADGGERALHLDQECGNDASLRKRVEALLRVQSDPDSFLDHPAVAGPETSGESTQPSETPEDASAAQPEESTPTVAETPAVDEDVLSLLAPPQRQGSLGRLGHYEVMERVGKGGFGIVLKAFDEKLHRMVAIKVL